MQYEINHYRWSGDYQPRVSARLSRAETALCLRMTAEEITANMRVSNSEPAISRTVHQDSCMEFFLMPSPETDKRYINFEINPAGARNIGIGENRRDRYRFNEEELKDIEISLFSKEIGAGMTKWGFDLIVPFSFLREFVPGFNPERPMRGNFYKCGDLTPLPHYGMWKPVMTENPDFHQPDYFGDIFEI